MDAELLRIKQQVQQDMHAWASTPRDEGVVADCDPSRAQKMPFVTLTYAQSIDGSIAAERGTPTLLSGALSMKMTHMLRTVHDGIVVGVGTILADNPSLNARFAEGRNPTPVIVDTLLRCPLSIKLFTSPTCEKPIILCANLSTDCGLRERKQALERAGAKVIECNALPDAQGIPHVDIRQGFELLRNEGLQSVMVEGGASILTACLQESARSHLVDTVIVTIAPTFIGGLRAVGGLLSAPTTFPDVATTAAFPRLRHPKYHILEEDLVVIGRLAAKISSN